MNYRFTSTKKLIESYISEYDRINKEDRKTTQKLIKQELLERTKRLIRVLEDEDNLKLDLKYKTLEEEVQGIIKHIWLQEM